MVEKQIHEMIDAQIQKLAADAKLLTDAYWHQKVKDMEKWRGKEKSVLGCRRRLQNGYLSIDWFKDNWTIRPESAPTDKGKARWKVYSRYLKRGRGFRYSDKTLLAHAKEWEKERILSYEDDFAKIREAYAALSKARQYMGKAIKAQKDRPPVSPPSE